MNFKKTLSIIAVLSAVIVFFRIVPMTHNFTPVIALFIVCGYVAGSRLTLLTLPLLAFLLTDLWLGVHASMLFVYVPLCVLPFVGRGMTGHWLNTLMNGLVGASIFFLISNFGVWWAGTLYSPSLDGLVDSYRMALPFYRATLTGTLITLSIFQFVSWVFRDGWQPLAVRRF